MSKSRQERGLPAGFGLNVPVEVETAAVQLGTYLEEEEGVSNPARVQEDGGESGAAKEGGGGGGDDGLVAHDVDGRGLARGEERHGLSRKVKPDGEDEGKGEKPLGRKKRQKEPERKQVNMNPETKGKVEELVDMIHKYSVQKDAKASELFAGLVDALYEARHHIDFSSVPLRGQWGSLTAKAFPVALKNVFQAGITTHYLEKQEGDVVTVARRE